MGAGPPLFGAKSANPAGSRAPIPRLAAALPLWRGPAALAAWRARCWPAPTLTPMRAERAR